MKNDNESKHRKSACSVKLQPAPEFILCPKCGMEVEFWTDETETACDICSYRIFRKEGTVH